MSYLALYRQFRPKTFDEIIGQEHVVKTLVNQINMDRVGHAYLFCGARGTGKTTAAKVFARAINCLSPKNGSPCGECEVCKRLESPTNLDILEMDAASNNKVEHIRDLRDKIQYPPVAGRYKVYIVDEVHMLTTEAFNALLKTLEEPPAHAVFILATTEVHKIPATILSRCLRFDFKLISTQKIAQFICDIFDKVGKKYQKEAVTLIAKAGEGSVRDALSIADICLSYSEGELTYDDVLEVLGTSDRAIIEQVIGAMFEGNVGKMLSLTDDLLMRGKSVSILNRDVTTALRDILVIKTCANASEVLGLPQDKLDELKKLSDKTSVHALLRSIEIFSVAEADLKYSTHPKIVFETAAVKASLPETDYNIDALIARINALEKRLENGDFVCKTDLEKDEPSVKVEAQKPADSAINSIKEENKKPETVTSPTQTSPNEKVKEEAKSEVKSPEKTIKQPEVDEDLASLMAMADQGGFFAEEEGSFAFSTPKQEEKLTNSTVNTIKEENKKIETDKKESSGQTQFGSKPVDQSKNGSVDTHWGGIIKKIRSDKEIMLFVACQDASIKSENNFLIVIAPGENEYNLLSKPENVNKLYSYAFDYGYDGVKVVSDGAGAEKEVAEQNESDQVEEFFDGENLTVKD